MPVSKNGQLFLITVAGPDHPGITSEMMKIAASSGDNILDMGQAVTHGLLSLSFVLEVTSADSNGHSPVVRDLLFKAKDMGLELEYRVLEKKDDIEETISDNNFILNCVAVDHITPAFIRDISTTLAESGINIKRIDKVSPGEFTSLEVMTQVPAGLDLKTPKMKLIDISTSHRVDMAFIKDNVFRRSKRLIVFDMDSTLIQTEVIDEIADEAGVGPQIREITEKAMNGEMDFDESLKQRVSQLKGLKADKLDEILKKLPLTPGVEDFIETVKGLGYQVALISGGFTYFANALKQKLGLDYAFANELEIINGELTGNITGTIVNAEQKALLVNLIAQQMHISMEQVVAIGDGANDLPMLSAAGLGIAFHAKDVVRREAEHHMSHGPMTSILYFLGIPGPQKR
ncbi:MAG: phosphoserine phosphatase SerB [Bacteriovoracaceae bacterium]|nr:phosphoserine phosphatase SerB [Bacteriovoracaceae bacterium]